MAERVDLHFVRMVTLTGPHSDANLNAPIPDEQQKNGPQTSKFLVQEKACEVPN